MDLGFIRYQIKKYNNRITKSSKYREYIEKNTL